MKKILLFLLLNFYGAVAQNPSDLDTSFNNIAIPANRHCLDYEAIAIETNSLGQMLIYGQGQILTFVDADQNLLHAFNFSSEIQSFKFDGDHHAILLVEDPILNSVALPNLFRIDLTTGAIDSSFVLDAAVTFNSVGNFASVHIWNNKLYVKAGSGFVNGVFKTIFRLNLDGSLDSTFNYSGESFYNAYYMPDGSVFMFRDYGSANPRVVRLNTDGSVNPEFGYNTGVFYNSVKNVTPAPNGDFYFFGHFGSTFQVIKVHADGTLAEDFTQTFIEGENLYNVSGMGVQADHKVVIAGYLNNVEGGSAISLFTRRLLTDGTFDPTFQNSNFEYQNSSGGGNYVTLEMLPNGKFYISNLEQFRHNGTLIKKVVRFNANGSKDNSFDKVCKGFTDGPVTAIAEQADGKLLVSGKFNSYNSIETRARLVRLLPDGSMDMPFFSNLGQFLYPEIGSLSDNSDTFTAIQVMPDGKILLAGNFLYEDLNGTTSETLLVLNHDGTTFKSFSENYGGGLDINLQSDGKALIFGYAYNLAGLTSETMLMRLDHNYDADSTFQTLGVSTEAKKFVVLPDDKILVSAAYNTGHTFKRYNSDGSLDSSFSSLYNLNFNVRNDGKIITYNEVNVGPFVKSFKRLNSNGAAETTLWQTNISYRPFLIQSDDKIIYFNSARALTRFTAAGAIDPTFVPKSFESIATPVTVMKILSDGRIAIGGNANFYDGQRVGKLTIINGDGPPLGTTDFSSGHSISIYPNPVKDIVAVASSEMISQIALFDIQGRLLETQTVNGTSIDVDLSTRTSGLYFLKVTSNTGTKTLKLIKE